MKQIIITFKKQISILLKLKVYFRDQIHIYMCACVDFCSF